VGRSRRTRYFQQVVGEDWLIDADLAKRLRTNLQEFSVYDEPLADLPVSPALDQPTALQTARSKCPRRESLPLSVQLEMLHEDHLYDLAKRQARELTTSDQLTSRLARGLDALRDKMYEQQVDELKARIRTSEAG
jgi:hypothetical protein